MSVAAHSTGGLNEIDSCDGSHSSVVNNEHLRSQLSWRLFVKRFGEPSQCRPAPALPCALPCALPSAETDGRSSRLGCVCPRASIELRLPSKNDPSSAVDVSCPCLPPSGSWRREPASSLRRGSSHTLLAPEVLRLSRGPKKSPSSAVDVIGRAPGDCASSAPRDRWLPRLAARTCGGGAGAGPCASASPPPTGNPASTSLLALASKKAASSAAVLSAGFGELTRLARRRVASGPPESPLKPKSAGGAAGADDSPAEAPLVRRPPGEPPELMWPCEPSDTSDERRAIWRPPGEPLEPMWPCEPFDTSDERRAIGPPTGLTTTPLDEPRRASLLWHVGLFFPHGALAGASSLRRSST